MYSIQIISAQENKKNTGLTTKPNKITDTTGLTKFWASIFISDCQQKQVVLEIIVDKNRHVKLDIKHYSHCFYEFISAVDCLMTSLMGSTCLHSNLAYMDMNSGLGSCIN